MAEPAGVGSGDGEEGGPPRAPHEHDRARPGGGTRLGTPRLHLRSCDSTNERARALALAGAPHGTLVSAEWQSAGRGRHGRSWLAPPGACLLCSVLLRGEHAPPTTVLPLIAGVAVCDAIGDGTRLKWPNDVVLGEALSKVAGILVEGRPQGAWAVVGIGVNVALDPQDAPPEIRSRAASLRRPVSAVEPLLAELLAALQSRLEEPVARALERWRALDALRGREVAWADGRGAAEGIDDDGRLLVRLGGGEQAALSAGDVHLSAAG